MKTITKIVVGIVVATIVLAGMAAAGGKGTGNSNSNAGGVPHIDSILNPPTDGGNYAYVNSHWVAVPDGTKWNGREFVPVTTPGNSGNNDQHNDGGAEGTTNNGATGVDNGNHNGQVTETPAPVVEETTTEPVVETPTTPEPVVETPTVETPAAEETTTTEPVVETPTVETPATETTTVETPAVETPVVEEPKVVKQTTQGSRLPADMVVLHPSKTRTVECTVGMGSLNSTFNVTAEAAEHLGH